VRAGGGFGLQGGYEFPAKLMVVDAFQTDVAPLLKDAGTYDVLSCQFAFHYCCASEERARCALRNIAAILRPGGHFIGAAPFKTISPPSVGWKVGHAHLCRFHHPIV